jgi:hypothetical protein
MKKRISKSMNMYVMFGLLAVLFISLGYLSMQTGREGFEEGLKKEEEEEEKKASVNITLPVSSDAPNPVGTKQTISISGGTQGFRGRESMTTPEEKKKEAFRLR